MLVLESALGCEPGGEGTCCFGVTGGEKNRVLREFFSYKPKTTVFPSVTRLQTFLTQVLHVVKQKRWMVFSRGDHFLYMQKHAQMAWRVEFDEKTKPTMIMLYSLDMYHVLNIYLDINKNMITFVNKD